MKCHRYKNRRRGRSSGPAISVERIVLKSDSIWRSSCFLKHKCLLPLLLSGGHKSIPSPPLCSLKVSPQAIQLCNHCTYVRKVNSSKGWRTKLVPILIFRNSGNAPSAVCAEIKCASLLWFVTENL